MSVVATVDSTLACILPCSFLIALPFRFSYPLVPEIVPLWALLVFSFAAPYLLYFAHYLFSRSLHDLHHAMLGTAEAISLTVLCTQSLKVRRAESFSSPVLSQ